MASNKIQPIETLPLNGTVQGNDKIFLPEVGELPTTLDVVDAPSDLSVENGNSDENHIVTVDNADLAIKSTHGNGVDPHVLPHQNCVSHVRSIAVRHSETVHDIEAKHSTTQENAVEPEKFSEGLIAPSGAPGPHSKFKPKRLKSMIKAVITTNDMMFKSRSNKFALTYNEVLSEREYLNKLLIVPTSKFRVIWDIVTTVLVLYLCIKVPLVMGFDWWKYPPALTVLDYLIDAWFCIDIVLNFRTGYMHDGKMVMEPKRIVTHYLKFWFLIDIVSVLPFEGVSRLIIIADNTRKSTNSGRKMVKVLSKWFKLPRLLRLGKLFRALKSYGKYANLVGCVLTVVFLTHITACFWVLFINPCEQISDIVFVPGEASEAVKSFYESPEYNGICSQASVGVYYAKAMHAAMAMLMGGSVRTFDNDLMRQAWEQKPTTLHVVSCVVMFLGATVIAILFAFLTTIVVKTANASWAFFNRQASVKEQLTAMRLPQELCYRVMRHYDYLWAQHLCVQSSFLDDPTLSGNLKREIRLHIYKPYFNESDLLSGLTDEIIMKLAAHLTPEICMPDEQIMLKGELGDRMWLVTEGTVFVTHTLGKESYNVRGENIVGAYEMVDQGPRMNTVCAEQSNFVELMMLESEQFHEIMNHYPEVFSHIRKTVSDWRRSLGGNTQCRQQHIMNHIQGLRYRYNKKNMNDFCLDSIEEQIQALTSTVKHLTNSRTTTPSDIVSAPHI